MPVQKPAKHGRDHSPGGEDPIPWGNGIYAIEVFENVTPLVAGDGAFEWEIPEDLDGAVLVKGEIYVTTASSSGTVQVQIRNETAAVDIFSTKLTIDVGDLNSKDSATPSVVNEANATVAWGDHLNIDVDAIGSGATGLGAILYFVPLATRALVLQGAKGDRGGITDWAGGWNSGTTYTTGESVSSSGSSYVAIQDSTGVEPGVTPGWEDYWQLLAQGQVYTTPNVVIFNRGFVIDAARKAVFDCQVDAEIVACRVYADRVATVELDVLKSTYAGYPGSLASIVGSSPPMLSAAAKSEDTALNTWTTTIAAGDVFAVDVVANDNATLLTLSLQMRRV